MFDPTPLRASPLIVLFLVSGLALAGQPWTGQLKGGGEVRVDPRTNRPTIQMDGRQQQLWDGVHQLEDGRELRVRSGRVVPNESILEGRRSWPRPEPELPADIGSGEPIIGLSPCQRLVARVCGAEGRCAAAESCDPARQLRAMERDEQQLSSTPDRTTFTSEKCREAMRDSFFQACEAIEAVGD